jgi:hypothetical protein
MSQHPITFCTHLARAVKLKQKTRTYKPLSPKEIAARELGDIVSPYGVVGDTLWVVEPFGYVGDKIVFHADCSGDGYRAPLSLPSGYTPATAGMASTQSRMTLTVTVVSVVSLIESLNEATAKATGTLPTHGRKMFLDEFKRQWNDAYPGKPWASDPLCWCIDFMLK